MVEIVKAKEHLTFEGLQKIVAIRATLNRGLSDELKAAFPETAAAVSLIRPIIPMQKISDPY